MSGIAGIINLDDRPAAAAELEQVLAPMTPHAPDVGRTWAAGPAALGHVQLKITPADDRDTQPVNRQDRVVLTADARLDNRAELTAMASLEGRTLCDRGHTGVWPSSGAAMPDSELLLAAWEKWGESCVEHLLGDFAFAIWDARERTLFAARDHFGIRPFFYALWDRRFIFASGLRGLLALPGLPRAPNEAMIGDYLLSVWDAPDDPHQTFYRDIYRLPPAHTLTLRNGRVKLRRYWTLERGREVKLNSDAEYLEAFRELLEQAVTSRLRSGAKAGSCLSGGLDSSAVCSVARQLLPDAEPLAVFFTKSPVPENDESKWVKYVVGQGGYELHELGMNSPLFKYEELLDCLGEPYCFDNADQDWTLSREAARNGVNVLFSGYFGDAAVDASLNYLLAFTRRHDWAGLLAEAQAASERAGGSLDYYFWETAGPELM